MKLTFEHNFLVSYILGRHFNVKYFYSIFIKIVAVVPIYIYPDYDRYNIYKTSREIDF